LSCALPTIRPCQKDVDTDSSSSGAEYQTLIGGVPRPSIDRRQATVRSLRGMFRYS
jgi:hypothetical protein